MMNLSEIDIVGDIRHKGMLMGIELVKNKSEEKTQFTQKNQLTKYFLKKVKNNGIYLRTLGNIVMLVPPLAITESELNLLLQKNNIKQSNLQNQR